MASTHSAMRSLAAANRSTIFRAKAQKRAPRPELDLAPLALARQTGVPIAAFRSGNR